MTFQSPWLLLGLLLLPAFAVAYGLGERRRKRAAAAFAAPGVAASVVPKQPGWRRHFPLALAGLATAALIGALARPQGTRAVPAQQAAVLLGIDPSGLMMAPDGLPLRLGGARNGAEGFLAKGAGKVGVGGGVFNNRAEAVASPTTDREAV